MQERDESRVHKSLEFREVWNFYYFKLWIDMLMVSDYQVRLVSLYQKRLEITLHAVSFCAPWQWTSGSGAQATEFTYWPFSYQGSWASKWTFWVMGNSTIWMDASSQEWPITALGRSISCTSLHHFLGGGQNIDKRYTLYIVIVPWWPRHLDAPVQQDVSPLSSRCPDIPDVLYHHFM